jgi:hypothetical protein
MKYYEHNNEFKKIYSTYVENFKIKRVSAKSEILD